MAEIERFFRSTSNVRYDVCLFWDFLNYLDIVDLRRFAAALRSHVHSGTRGHAFAAFTAVSAFSGLRFDLRDVNRLVVRSDRGPTPFRHTNNVIGRVLWPLGVSRAMLLEHNRQELLLESREP